MRKERVWLGTPMDSTPINGVAEILGNTFQFEVANMVGRGGKLGKSGDCKTDVRASRNVGVE
jgi:hypothetical protein